MSGDHDRLDALRRLARDRAATPAEKATARRLADALAAKIGKRPRRSRRKGHAAALPEPQAARWRRRGIIWLEAALHKMAVVGKWMHGVWIVSLIGLVIISVLGSESVQRQTSDIYLVRTLGLIAAAWVMMAIAGVLALAAWWLRTWRGERLRPALMFLSEHVPWLAMMAACSALSVYLEDHLAWPWLLAFATTFAVIFAISIPWWRWVYPAMKRGLLRASHGALTAGVIVARGHRIVRRRSLDLRLSVTVFNTPCVCQPAAPGPVEASDRMSAPPWLRTEDGRRD
jgi:hypothetical protein